MPLSKQQIEGLFGRDAILVPYAALAVVEKDFSVQVKITLDNVDEVGYNVKEVNN